LRRLNSIAEWQRAIDIENFPLRLLFEVRFETVGGFLPTQLEGKKTRFECYHDDAAEVMNVDGDFDFGRRWAYALGSELLEISQSCERPGWRQPRRATAGVVYDPQDNRLYTASEALTGLHQMERDWPAMKAAVQEVTRKLTTKP
jgi:hypothetical protein